MPMWEIWFEKERKAEGMFRTPEEAEQALKENEGWRERGGVVDINQCKGFWEEQAKYNKRKEETDTWEEGDPTHWTIMIWKEGNKKWEEEGMFKTEEEAGEELECNPIYEGVKGEVQEVPGKYVPTYKRKKKEVKVEKERKIDIIRGIMEENPGVTRKELSAVLNMDVSNLGKLLDRHNIVIPYAKKGKKGEKE